MLLRQTLTCLWKTGPLWERLQRTPSARQQMLHRDPPGCRSKLSYAASIWTQNRWFICEEKEICNNGLSCCWRENCYKLEDKKQSAQFIDLMWMERAAATFRNNWSGPSVIVGYKKVMFELFTGICIMAYNIMYNMVYYELEEAVFLSVYWFLMFLCSLLCTLFLFFVCHCAYMYCMCLMSSP